MPELTMEVSPTERQPRWHRILFDGSMLRVPWRLLLFFSLAFLVGGPIHWLEKLAIRAFHLHRPTGPEMSPQPIFVMELPIIFMMVGASWIMAKLERRSLANYGLRWDKQSFARYGEGFGYGVLGCGLVLLVMKLSGVFDFGELALHGGTALRYCAVWFLAYFVVGVMEEYQFRGYLLTTLSEGIAFWPAATLLSAWFAYEHLGNPGETKVGIFSVFAFGMLFSWSVRITGSLWLAIGFHQSWDFAQSFLFGVPDSGVLDKGRLLNPAFHGPVLLTGGSVGPEGSVITFMFLAVFASWLYVRFQPRRNTEESCRLLTDEASGG